MNKRDDFTQQTKDKLCERVGGKCSNPNCRKETKGPHSDPRKSVSIGEAAHITAASEGGPDMIRICRQRKEEVLKMEFGYVAHVQK